MDQNSLFRFSIDNAMEIIIIFDDTGTILYGNRSASNALEYFDELCRNSIADIFPGEFSVQENGMSYTCSMDGNYQNMMVYRKNRTCFPAKVKFLIHNEAAQKFSIPGQRFDDLPLYGGQRTYICMVTDISKEDFREKKVNNADKEVEAALKVKSEFIANVTHELRTPVNGILGNTMELLEKEEEKSKIRLLHLVERGCRDMNSIINNVLDFSKLEAGKFTLEKREFEFGNMIEYVEANHRPRITEKGLDFSITVSPDIPQIIIGDELRIVQILNNLISNAYKFTSVGGIHVEVVKTAVSENRMELFFMVMDSGIGISKADMDKLFKSFSQVDASISRKYGGTGLGLNICKQLVELMGGNINVESTTGKGSTFSFQIWVDTPKEHMEECSRGDEEDNRAMFVTDYSVTAATDNLLSKLQSLSAQTPEEDVRAFGTDINKTELEKKMSKLILCVEMENWEKAEMFADAIKQLVEGGPREVKSAALRMKMAVQKGDYDKSQAAYELLQQSL